MMNAPTPKSIPRYSLEQPFSVGYWNYVVHSAAWKSSIYELGEMKAPDSGTFLVVDASVCNSDRTESTRPQFKLVDAQGREFSEYIMWEGGALNTLQMLNPSVCKRGLIFFDAPAANYNLVMSGGYESTDLAIVYLRTYY
jgi:hypothetical protein